MKGARRLQDLHFRAEPAQVAQLDALAAARCVPLADLLREALAQYLAQVDLPPAHDSGLHIVWAEDSIP